MGKPKSFGVPTYLKLFWDPQEAIKSHWGPTLFQAPKGPSQSLAGIEEAIFFPMGLKHGEIMDFFMEKVRKTTTKDGTNDDKYVIFFQLLLG